MQWALFHGSMSVGANAKLSHQIKMIKAENKQLFERNKKVYAQVLNLKDNANATEILAREELGLVKPGEIFYRYGPSQE